MFSKNNSRFFRQIEEIKINKLEQLHVIKQFYESINFDINLVKDFDKIVVEVSGGLDSTLNAIYFNAYFPTKVKYLNCDNPYEKSITLEELSQCHKFISIKNSDLKLSKQKLIESFELLPYRYWQTKILKMRYNKHMFPCCNFLKHRDFLKSGNLLKNNNTCVISGIKAGDGQQRKGFLGQLRNGRERINRSKKANNYYSLTENKAKSTFIHKHKSGIVKVYPFRDYKKREFPAIIINILKEIYPNISHSGCQICPILVLNKINKEPHDRERWEKSIIKINHLVNKLIKNPKKRKSYLFRILIKNPKLRIKMANREYKRKNCFIIDFPVLLFIEKILNDPFLKNKKIKDFI